MVGRDEQQKELENYLNSDRSEFIIITGRRRIGKTFLINELYKDKFSFYYTGGHNLSKQRQLKSFALALQKYGKLTITPTIKDWFEAFQLLQHILEKDRKRNKKIIFIDEMPWIDTPKSEFVTALEQFWNSWASLQRDIFFVASGSATSWMADKLYTNQGGLHNRITHRIHLQPFTLHESEQYLQSIGCKWDKYQQVQAYMIFGGIPFYLSLISPKESLAQNVDRLFFSANAQLRKEFDELYPALFAHSENYIQVVRTLAEKRSGMTRAEIIQKTSLQGSTLTKILNNLCLCDFVVDYAQYSHIKQGTIYRLADFYTLFYLHFIEKDNKKDIHRWTHIIQTPKVNSWQGISFELVCLTHLQQIKHALGIDGIETATSTWRNEDMQIDLIIERGDRLINLCEIKFSKEPYTISKEYAEHIRLRAALFRDKTKTRKGLINTFITTYGTLQGKNNGIVDSEIKMEQLFHS